MYKEADKVLRQRVAAYQGDDSPPDLSRDSEWQQGIELFLAASQRESCRFYRWYDSAAGALFDGEQLARHVLVESQARIEAGDLEVAAKLHDGLLNLAAHYYDQNYETVYRGSGMAVEQQLFDMLPEWASQDSLTAERVRQVLSQVQTWFADHRPDWEANVIEYRRPVELLIAMDDEIMLGYYEMGATERGAFKALGTLLPWERLRMLRLLNVCTEAELQGMRELRARGVGMPAHVQRTLQWDVRLDLAKGKQQLIRSTDVEVWLRTTRWLQMSSSLTAPTYVLWEKQYQVRRNAVQLQLALIAWRKSHGELPETLHKLLDDHLESLPRDPYTNQRFFYFPDGIEEEVWDDVHPFGGMAMMGGEEMSELGMTEGDMVSPKPRLVRSEPFLWSPGEQLYYEPGGSDARSQSPNAGDFRDQQGNAMTQTDLLHRGVRYPIPPAKQQPPDSADNANALPNDA
ncbi:MAG: hypothetical protein HYV60_16605 [Planctomycetia bacterium]|nr:hypothetical protein [Planctomycetia bacterium]